MNENNFNEMSDKQILDEFQEVSENLESTEVEYTVKYQLELYNEILKRMSK